MPILTNVGFGVELEFILPYKGDIIHPQRYLCGELAAAGIRCLSRSGDDTSSDPHHWVLKKDLSIITPLYDYDRLGLSAFTPILKVEISSPVLRGEQGLAAIEKTFGILASLGACANESCGYHVHASPAGRRYTEQELRNFVTAAVKEEESYSTLIEPGRIHNPSCDRYMSSFVGADTNIQNSSTRALTGTEEVKDSKINLSQIETLGLFGKILPFSLNPARNPFMKAAEFRGKEAEGFTIDQGAEHLDYTATVVNFTGMAIKNPRTTFRDAAIVACRGKPPSAPRTRSLILANQPMKYVS